MSIDKIKENGFKLTKEKKTEDTLHIQLQTWTMPKT